MQAAQKRHDDGGKPVAHIEINGDLAGWACHLEQSRKPGQSARYTHADQDQPARMYPGKRRSPGALAGQLDIKSQDMATEGDIGKDHGDQRGDHPPMQAGVGDQFQIGGRRILRQVARSGKAHPLGVAQQTQRRRCQKLLGHIDQHERDQNLVGAKAHPQNCRDHRP